MAGIFHAGVPFRDSERKACFRQLLLRAVFVLNIRTVKKHAVILIVGSDR
jgi:hypothetical protein